MIDEKVGDICKDEIIQSNTFDLILKMENSSSHSGMMI